jgi:hypothetical protein
MRHYVPPLDGVRDRRRREALRPVAAQRLSFVAEEKFELSDPPARPITMRGDGASVLAPHLPQANATRPSADAKKAGVFHKSFVQSEPTKLWKSEDLVALPLARSHDLSGQSRPMACSRRLLDELAVKVGVFPAGGDELAVCAALDDPAVVDHEDAIGLLDRAQAVRDDEGRSTLEQALERLLHDHFGGRIDGAGGLVEHEDARVGEERAREADELALSEAHVGAALADVRVIPILQR